MTIINDSEIVVYTSEELKQVLEGNNTYTYIYFGDNITLTKGITISNTKTNIIIDGTYNKVTYNFEDKKSTSSSDTITVSSFLKTITVKNMNITGYNYYGIIYVPENSQYKDVVVEYSNVSYVGPQMSYHPTGLTRFINSNIVIKENYAAGNEVAECNKIEIGGVTTIVHESTLNSSFWFRNSNPSLTILPNAVVDFTSKNRELIYGVSNLTLTISKNAKFDVTVHDGLSYGTYGTGTTLIEQNASFIVKQTNLNGSYSTWYSYGKITVNENATLEIINDYQNITASNYNISFQGAAAGLIINNPYRVMLYNQKANVINTNSNIPFEFNFSRINLSNVLLNKEEKISKETLPEYSWYKDQEISMINGTFTNTKVVISGNNFTEEELKKLPSLDNFIFQTKKVLTIGILKLHVNALTETDTVMKGLTEPDASILISYKDENIVALADSQGAFSYAYDVPLPEGTIITFTVKENNELIYETRQIQIVYSGDLLLESASKLISFKLLPIKLDPIICPRNDELKVTVMDSRVNSTNWKLYVSVVQDLTSSNGIVLEDSLVFVDEDDNIIPLTKAPVLVYTGEKNDEDVKVTNVMWDENKGILLRIMAPLINQMDYSAIISWDIEE